MSRISIVDLEVFYCVGVTDEERAKPQRLLLTVDMSLDFSSASISDRIEKTIDYQQVVDELLKFPRPNVTRIDRSGNLPQHGVAEFCNREDRHKIYLPRQTISKRC